MLKKITVLAAAVFVMGAAPASAPMSSAAAPAQCAQGAEDDCYMDCMRSCIRLGHIPLFCQLECVDIVC